MPCYFDPVSFTTASEPYHTNGSPPPKYSQPRRSQIANLPPTANRTVTNQLLCQPTLHHVTPPPPLPFHNTKWHDTVKASVECVRTGRLWYFANYPTAPQCQQCQGITMSQCRQFQLFCHVAVPTVSSFQCHHSTVSSFYSIFVLFHNRTGLPIVSNNHHSNNETVQTKKLFQRIIIPEYDPKVCRIKVCVRPLANFGSMDHSMMWRINFGTIPWYDGSTLGPYHVFIVAHRPL